MKMKLLKASASAFRVLGSRVVGCKVSGFVDWCFRFRISRSGLGGSCPTVSSQFSDALMLFGTNQVQSRVLGRGNLP